MQNNTSRIFTSGKINVEIQFGFLKSSFEIQFWSFDADHIIWVSLFLEGLKNLSDFECRSPHVTNIFHQNESQGKLALLIFGDLAKSHGMVCARAHIICDDFHFINHSATAVTNQLISGWPCDSVLMAGMHSCVACCVKLVSHVRTHVLLYLIIKMSSYL